MKVVLRKLINFFHLMSKFQKVSTKIEFPRIWSKSMLSFKGTKGLWGLKFIRVLRTYTKFKIKTKMQYYL